MLITATKITEYRKLADDLDAALARGDDMGMEMLTAMLPELGETIEEINDALRSVAALLFEGLRDEAIGLHHPALPEVALRLHLPDKPQWPTVGVYLESIGIKPPRPLDFETLTAFNAAFAEADALRKPLDKLRRYALQRVPLPTKIDLLRKLKAHDGLKPVWADQLAAHEESRMLELGDAVKRALDARDPEQVATLHAEVTDSGWSTPVSQRLQNDTRGGDVWRNLRRKVGELELVAKDLAERHAAGNQADAEDSEQIHELRDLRDRWVDGERRCREWMFTLPQYPAIARFVHEESFGPRLDVMRELVTPALGWLSLLDRRDAMKRQFEAGCNDIEYMVEHLPASRQGEAAWIAKADKTMAGLQQLCQQMPMLRIPDLLLTRLERSTAEVRRRGRARSRNVIIAALGGTLLAAAVIGVVWQVIDAREKRLRVVHMIKERIPLAKRGEFVVRPDVMDAAVAGYEKDTEIMKSLDEFDRHAKAETERREEFESILKKHEALLKAVGQTLEEWKADSSKAMGEWPEAMFQAERTYELLRAKGGFPGNRKSDGPKVSGARPASDEDLPPQAAQQSDSEETRLAQQYDAQSRLISALENASLQEFKRQLQVIQDEMPSQGDANAVEVANRLLTKLETLLEVCKKPRSQFAKSPQRVPYEARKLADPVRARLEASLE